MAQHDYTIANQGFPAFRSDLNNALAAIVSNNSGATEPTTMFAHQLWVDTAANPSVLKIRNADNDAWITLGTINQTNDTYTLVADAIGVGTSDPSGDGFSSYNDLVVSSTGNSGITIKSGASSAGGLAFNDAAGGLRGAVAYDHSNDSMPFVTAGGTRMTIDSSGNVGIGTSSPSAQLHLYKASGSSELRVQSGSTFGYMSLDGSGNYIGTGTAVPLIFTTNNTERSRIDPSGNLLVGKTAASGSVAGAELRSNGLGVFVASSSALIYANRLTTDGNLIELAQDGTTEGIISVSGTTVSYNGGHLSRWAQTLSAKDSSLKKGTVLSNLDEMNVYVKPTLYWTEEDELPVDEEGNPTVAVGDVKQETSISDNEQLNKVKVSDVEGDPNVAGVFVNWSYDEAHEVDEINMAMTGDMIIRIAEGVTVARGDLLMSAGDGTAKPQGDDIVRSKTIAKVTSTHVACTYDDGSYCVPCVLMAC